MPSILVVSLVVSPMIYFTGRWRVVAARDVTLAGLGVLWLALAYDMLSGGMFRQSIPFNFDGLSRLIVGTVLSLSTLVTVYSGPDIRGRAGEEKYYALLLLLTGGVIGLVTAGDLFNLWVWFELTAICSYLLVGFRGGNTSALAACAKYLIQATTGSILVLFGIALVFAQTGSLDLAHTSAAYSPLMIVAGTLFIIGFGVKMALVPTYTWLPAAYTYAPPGISAVLSGIVTITGMVALLRSLVVLNGLGPAWGAVLIGFGTVNIVVGNLLALRQVHIKRLFAYSSISHIGFMLLAVGIGIYAGVETGFLAGMLHLGVHALMKALAFLAVGAAAYMYGRSDSSLRVSDLAGLGRYQPMLAVALVAACLSLAGIPPLAGFMSKWLIFDAGLRTGDTVITLLVIFAALNSVFSLAYYFPVINALLQTDAEAPQRPLPAAMRIPVLVLTGAILVLGLYPLLLGGLVNPASQTLAGMFGG